MSGNEDAPKGGYDPMAAKEISPLVAWLCSDLAKDVNGQVFAVNGQRIQRVRRSPPVDRGDIRSTVVDDRRN